MYRCCWRLFSGFVVEPVAYATCRLNHKSSFTTVTGLTYMTVNKRKENSDKPNREIKTKT